MLHIRDPKTMTCRGSANTLSVVYKQPAVSTAGKNTTSQNSLSMLRQQARAIVGVSGNYKQHSIA